MKPEKIKKLKNGQGEFSRDMMVIRGYALYRSTGSNSGMENVLLPFTDISEENFNLGGYKTGDFTKPPVAFAISGFDAEASLIEYFGEEIPKISGIPSAQLARFGNLECMLISLALDPASWKSESLMDLKKYLLKNYADFIKKISESYVINSSYDKEFKDVEKNRLEIAKNINRHLKDLGKKFSEENFPNHASVLERLKSSKDLDEKEPDHKQVYDKTALTLTEMLSDNPHQQVIKGEDKVSIAPKELKIKYNDSVIDIFIADDESAPETLAKVMEELLTLSVNGITIDEGSYVIPKIDISSSTLESKTKYKISLHLTADAGKDEAKTEALLDAIDRAQFSDKSVTLKEDLSCNPLFKDWATRNHLQAIDELKKILNENLKLLHDNSPDIRKKFNVDGSYILSSEAKKAKLNNTKHVYEHKVTRALLNILNDATLPKKRIKHFIKFFQENQKEYFNLSPAKQYFFKNVSIGEKIINCLDKNKLLDKEPQLDRSFSR